MSRCRCIKTKQRSHLSRTDSRRSAHFLVSNRLYIHTYIFLELFCETFRLTLLQLSTHYEIKGWECRNWLAIKILISHICEVWTTSLCGRMNRGWGNWPVEGCRRGLHSFYIHQPECLYKHSQLHSTYHIPEQLPHTHKHLSSGSWPRLKVISKTLTSTLYHKS